MSFLAPLLLAGLAALAVPIVLHLLQRERHDVVEFPSLMFLRRIPQETTKRRRLRHWLLLAARCLLLALLALAFARPFLRGRAAAIGGGDGAREVVVLLDRSASMGHGDRWARAQATARSVIDGLGDDDRLTLVAFDASAEALNEGTGDRAALGTLVGRARPGAGATRYGPALRLAQGVLEESDRARREVVVVSDFQQAGWDGAPDVRLPAGTALRRVSVASGPAPNATVAAVDVARGTAAGPAGTATAGQETVALTARVRNLAAEPVLGRRVELELNGRVLQARSVDLPASGTVPVRFDAVALPPEASRGVVRLAPDALAADDAHHFVVSRAQVRPALVIEAAGAPAGSSLYLVRALSLARDPGYAVTVRQAGAVRPADVAGAALVVLNDAAPPAGDVGRRIAARVREGAGLLAILGDRSGSRWSGPLAELAPLDVGEARDRRDPTGAALGYVERTHPVFAPFRGGRGGDFAAARIFRYRELQPGAGATVLARHGDGSVALAETEAGRGRVLVWASALDNRWSDLPVQPVFLPLVHELARHASGQPPATPALVVGQAVDVASYAALYGGARGSDSLAGAAPGQWLAIAPSGERVRLGGSEGLALAPREAGFYQLRALSGDTRPQPLAVNVDPAESDLTPLDTAAFVVATGDRATAAGAAATRSPVEEEARQSLWWFLLAGALLLLGLESAYANRLAVRTR
jgi:hypothetical protein